jgi:hypothetical protein
MSRKVVEIVPHSETLLWNERNCTCYHTRWPCGLSGPANHNVVRDQFEITQVVVQEQLIFQS